MDASLRGNSVIYTIAEKLGYAKIQPRSSSPLGLFAKYDGNIIGGSLLGAGMALSGSCPGTLYAQLGAGVRTGFHALNGAVIGGILWTGLVSKVVKNLREKQNVKPEPGSLNDKLGLSRDATALLLEAACLAAVTAITLYTPPYPTAVLSGLVGGLIIGFSQLVSIVTRKTMMGISGSFEEAGNFFWWFIGGADANSKPKSHQNVLFAVGAGVGAWILSLLFPALTAAPVHEVSPILAMTGGVLMGVGSRMAGGCTSGHGISGISLLSMSSVVTIASTFAAGGIVASLVH